MEQLNRVELRGVVGSLRHQKVGDKTCSHINVATSRAYKDRNGVAVIETTWHQVIAWEGPNTEDVARIEKGSKVYVLGRIRNARYVGKDDQERESSEIVASRLMLMDTAENLQYEM